MFDFNKDWFIDKVRKHGIEIIEYAGNTFMLPGFLIEIPELRVSCAYCSNNNTISIVASIPIAENVFKQTITALCDKLNSIAKFYTYVQGDFIASGMELNFSKIAYTDNNDALEYAAAFILMFKQEFDRYGVKAYQYANTGDINYLT